ncbi:hypothetical protein GJ744_004467 [Endocarpon pusillum]|uniref:Uncharacterized protein n=1 Tax=Endocarpon pusillum TaxID=364733 RepID=A0A8H7ATN0_9EURO|nr:hypothetical protein GJ744_004467 [Endocarpon pusillum]
MTPSLNDPRYRPALLALAGISAAYAIYLIRQRYLTPQQNPDRQTQLRRRNAIRRHDLPRRNRTRSSPRGEDSIEVSEQAIAALRSREADGRSYGFLDIHSIENELGQDTARRHETQWPLLPGMLPTVEQFQTQEGIAEEDAQGLRNHAELMFMDAFLANQYPPSHHIASLEAGYLSEALSDMGIGSVVIQQSIERFNTDPNFGSEMRQNSNDGAGNPAGNPALADAAAAYQRFGDLMQALNGEETIADEQSNFEWREGNGAGSADRQEQNTLNLLYNIAADKARMDGYIHRGVTCDGCHKMPIHGIRYRCANCLDYDLCESCEAQELHIKTHVFYKIRVPAPSMGALGNSRQGLPVWYPGKPSAMPPGLPRQLSSRLLHETGFDTAELDALWDQFRCLAGCVWTHDPNKLGMAIDRKVFDRCFVPPLSIRPPPPNLIYDRMFAYYDTNNDGLIGFEEFLKGLAGLNDKSREGKLRRIFQGYDIDNDGYIDRKDFLRIFRAFYTLSKELNREMLAGMEEDLMEGGAREIIHGSQPISSAFPSNIPDGHVSRGGTGKEVDANGDLTITDHRGVLDEDAHDIGDRNQIIADIAISYPATHPRSFRRQTSTDSPLPGTSQVESVAPNIDSAPDENPLTESYPPTNEGGSSVHDSTHSWPPFGVRVSDIVNALGREVPVSEIIDPDERRKVQSAVLRRVEAEIQADIEQRSNDAIQERWRRRRFYTDVEEGGSAPQGYTEIDSSDDGTGDTGEAIDSVTSASASRPLSPRSRSSSKVRFEDSVTDTDYETRSNTSSRSIPVGERWGGYDISEIEKDVGKEILYQAVQQGFNELLDQLFKEKEDLTMEAHRTRKERRHHAKEIQAYAAVLKAEPGGPEHTRHESKPKKEKATTTASDQRPVRKEVELSTLLHAAGYGDGDADSDPGLEADANALSPTNPPPPPPDHPLYTNQTQIYRYSTPDYLDRDPTMPQFRPNDSETAGPTSASTSTSPLPSAEPATTTIPPSIPPMNVTLTTTTTTASSPAPLPAQTAPADLSDLSSPQTREMLTKYLLHDQIDAEAKTRGGFGRLDYAEFVRGMVGNDSNNNNNNSSSSRGRTGNGSGAVGDGDVTGREIGGEKQQQLQLGRLGFVGSWIEMASF